MSTGRPVALITTSGTAVAELLPAVVEAYQSQLPLILLTADRPASLRDTGANQTIFQAGLFGIYAKSVLDLPVLTSDELTVSTELLKKDVAALFALCTNSRPGPVHLNIQLEKPFEPNDLAPYKVRSPMLLNPPGDVSDCLQEDLGVVSETLVKAERGLIIVGPNRYPATFATAIIRIAQATGMPVLADPLSGLRHIDIKGQSVVVGYDAMLQGNMLDDLRCDLILRFGTLPVSLPLLRFMEASLEADCPHLYVNDSKQIHDESQAVTHYLSSPPTLFCEQLLTRISACRRSADWLRTWQRLSSHVAAVLEDVKFTLQDWDGAYVLQLLASLSSQCILFVGNSLPVRLVDLVGYSPNLKCRVHGNRGASGIDGLVSTALGIAHSTNVPVCLLIGDLSLLHDIGGLAAVRHLAVENLTVVLLNNHGGGIFERLPISRLGPAFEELFIAHHETSFAKLAEAFGLQYYFANSPSHLASLVSRAVASSKTHVIEVVTDRRQDLAQAEQFIQLVAERCIRGNS